MARDRGVIGPPSAIRRSARSFAVANNFVQQFLAELFHFLSSQRGERLKRLLAGRGVVGTGEMQAAGNDNRVGNTQANSNGPGLEQRLDGCQERRQAPWRAVRPILPAAVMCCLLFAKWRASSSGPSDFQFFA